MNFALFLIALCAQASPPQDGGGNLKRQEENFLMRRIMALFIVLILAAAAMPHLASANSTLPGTYIPDRYAVWELFLMTC
jgi:hypothetical protein